MSITRTAKGTATDKTGAATLVISSVQVERRLLVVGIAYDVGSGSPVIKWGNQLLTPMSTVSGNGVTTRLAAYRRRRDPKTKDIVATWQSPVPTAKAMFASTFSEVGTIDLTSGLSQAATGSPNSGTAATPNFDDEVYIGAMGSEGPSSDAAGTPSNSYTAGQRAGTAGAPPVSNITIQEIYKIVSAAESTQAALTGATSRHCSSVLTTWRDRLRRRFSILFPYDYEEMEDIFDAADLDMQNGVMRYNELLERNEMYEVDLEAHGTLKATWEDDDTNDWVTV